MNAYLLLVLHAFQLDFLDIISEYEIVPILFQVLADIATGRPTTVRDGGGEIYYI